MKKYKRKAWEIDIGMKATKKHANIDRFNQLINKSIDIMLNKALSELNRENCLLSTEAKKRLKWMYLVHFEYQENISQSARRIGVSRQWLSKLHSNWINSGQDPCSLEPKSRAPNHTSNRRRINRDIEHKIIAVRKEYHWGQDKLVTILDRDYRIRIGASTVNRYLNKHRLLDIRISKRIKMAHQNKIEQKQKCRPPQEIKDYKPGALVEKDMKYIMRMGSFVNRAGFKIKTSASYWCQHTVIDSFTRIRTLGLAEDSDSQTAVAVQEDALIHVTVDTVECQM